MIVPVRHPRVFSLVFPNLSHHLPTMWNRSEKLVRLWWKSDKTRVMPSWNAHLVAVPIRARTEHVAVGLNVKRCTPEGSSVLTWWHESRTTKTFVESGYESTCVRLLVRASAAARVIDQHMCTCSPSINVFLPVVSDFWPDWILYSTDACYHNCWSVNTEIKYSLHIQYKT